MLKGKNAIITGSRRGIGRACVELFADYGANVWACARKPDETFEADMAELAERCGVWIKPLYFDLTDAEAMRAAVMKVRERKVPIDAIINNAGMIAPSSSFAMLSEEKMRGIFDVNFFSHVMLTQYFIRVMMRQRSGAIVWISSTAALDGEPGQFEYTTSKMAMAGAARRLAVELAEFGIRVNAIAPGMIETEMNDAMAPELSSRIMSGVALGRRGAPREVAEAAAFLASDKASYITKQILRVDGGM